MLMAQLLAFRLRDYVSVCRDAMPRHNAAAPLMMMMMIEFLVNQVLVDTKSPHMTIVSLIVSSMLSLILSLIDVMESVCRVSVKDLWMSI